MRKKLTPETQLKRAIKNLLKNLGIFHFHVLQGLGAYKGISDFLAIMPAHINSKKAGVLIAIEAKAPKGRLSQYQKEFLEAIEKNGGIAIPAWSVDDVIDGLGVRDRFLF